MMKGKVVESISKNTRFFITGSDVGPSKRQKVDNLLAGGAEITCLTETEILTRLDEILKEGGK